MLLSGHIICIYQAAKVDSMLHQEVYFVIKVLLCNMLHWLLSSTINHKLVSRYYNKEWVRSIPTAKVGKNSRGTIPTVFLYFIYHSRPSMMLKYVKTCQNNRPYSPEMQLVKCLSRPLSSQNDFRVSSFVAVGPPRRFVSILISCALA